MKPIIR